MINKITPTLDQKHPTYKDLAEVLKVLSLQVKTLGNKSIVPSLPVTMLSSALWLYLNQISYGKITVDISLSFL